MGTRPNRDRRALRRSMSLSCGVSLRRVASQMGVSPARKPVVRWSFVAILLVASVSCARDLEWFFLPTGQSPRPELARLAPDFDRAGWHKVSPPHAFDRIQREDGVWGWYAASVPVPAPFQGRDLVVDLGVVDDADVTYLNGVRIGATGSLTDENRSAWNQDRVYLAPTASVKAGGVNLLAIQVKDFGGIGGLLGRPFVGAALTAERTCQFLAEDRAPEKAALTDADLALWTSIPLPLAEWPSRKAGYGWYRFCFDLPSDLAAADALVDLGVVYDAAECYVNGVPISEMGRFPPDAFLQTGARLRCVLPARLLRPAGNVLAVRVYGTGPFGGLAGTPAFAFLDQDVLAGHGTASEALAAKAGGPDAQHALSLCDYLVHSGQESLVAETCAALLPGLGGDPDTAHRVRCLRVYALWLAGQDDRAWNEVVSLDFSRAIRYATASALAALGPHWRKAATTALYLGRDTATRGDWDLRYGVNDAILCGMDSPYTVRHGLGPGLRCDLRCGDGQEKPRAWLGARETTDPRGLFLPETGKRRYASWDDRGEIRPFDDNGPDLLMAVAVPSGAHHLSLYLVDWDWHAGSHPRMETVFLLDGKGRPQCVVATGKFGGGQYERFLVQGPVDLTVRVNKHRSPCAVLSGVFLDRCEPNDPPAFQGVLPAHIRPLAERYAALSKAYKADPISTMKSDRLAELEATCRAESRKPDAASAAHWWLAECRRLRADLAGAQTALEGYLAAVKRETAQEKRRQTLEAFARTLDRLQYRPEAVLAAMRAAELAQSDREAGLSLQGMAAKSLRAGIWRAYGRWAAANPTPSATNPPQPKETAAPRR